ncbi:MAG TPA: ATP-binding protein [Pyrinomonadaceae bacterium]|nr:ATP-binding protein [Pyrinomonadaceae bacterium]
MNDPPTPVGGILLSISLLLAVLFLSPLVGLAQPSSPPNAKRILLLNNYGREVPGALLFDQGFDKVVKSQPPATIEVYRETLDIYRFPDANHALVLRNYLKEKYRGMKMNVIVAFPDTALDFLVHNRDLFPEVPIVYVASKKPEPGTEPASSTGLWAGPNIKDTLEIALQLLPGTQQVFVSGSTLNTTARMNEEETENQLREFASRVKITYLTGDLDEVLKTVKSLPPKSIVLAQRTTRGFGGKTVVPRDAGTLIAGAANVPVFGVIDTWVGQGIVGGRVISHEALGRRSAEMTLQIANGAKAEEIPMETGELLTMFDWRQLRRWGISESALPAGSRIEFKEVTFWEHYKWRIIGVLALCSLEALLIAVLLVERRRRQRANESLDERLRFETLLAKLSAEFAELPTHDVELTINKWIKQLTKFLDVDKVEFVAVSAGDSDHGKSLALPGLAHTSSGVYLDQLRRGEIVNLDRVQNGLPSDKGNEHANALKSLLAIPVAVNGSRCALVFSEMRHHRVWPEDLVPRLRVIAEIFGSAIERERAGVELQKTRTDLAHVARLTAMGEMAASIAHEVNQPLTAIATYGDACVHLLAGDSPNVKKSLEAIEHIKSDSIRASEVIKRIRSLVKKTDREDVPVDLNEVIREVIALTEGDLRAHKIELQTQLTTELTAVKGDRVELQQVVLNLILNSIEAMSTISDRERELRITSRQDETGQLLVSVDDSGVGLDPQHGQRIFEHFVTTKPTGLGMGLSISRTIIETHGGKLWAEPNKPYGARFQFTLPPITAET